MLIDLNAIHKVSCYDQEQVQQDQGIERRRGIRAAGREVGGGRKAGRQEQQRG